LNNPKTKGWIWKIDPRLRVRAKASKPPFEKRGILFCNAMDYGLHNIKTGQGSRIGAELSHQEMFRRVFSSYHRGAHLVTSASKENIRTGGALATGEQLNEPASLTLKERIKHFRTTGNAQGIVQLWREMREDERDTQTNLITLTWLVAACADSQNVQEGRAIHEMIRSKGIQLDPILGTTLINMYGKHGSSPEEAYAVFEDMRKNGIADLRTWTAMISVYQHC